MASIFHYGPYEFTLSDPGLAPGDTQTWGFGPWDWSQHVIQANARPRVGGVVDEAELSVVSAWMKYDSQTGEYFVITIQNIGTTPIISYEVWLGGTMS